MINPTLKQKLLDNGYTGEMSLGGLKSQLTLKHFPNEEGFLLGFTLGCVERLEKQGQLDVAELLACYGWLELNKN